MTFLLKYVGKFGIHFALMYVPWAFFKRQARQSLSAKNLLTGVRGVCGWASPQVRAIRLPQKLAPE
jgi:hypothetical protein